VHKVVTRSGSFRRLVAPMVNGEEWCVSAVPRPGWRRSWLFLLMVIAVMVPRSGGTGSNGAVGAGYPVLPSTMVFVPVSVHTLSVSQRVLWRVCYTERLVVVDDDRVLRCRACRRHPRW